MKKNLTTALTLVSAITIVAMACNNNKMNDPKTVATQNNETKFSDTDKEKDAKFLVTAAEINLEEIKLGQLAQSKSTTPEVKELGKMMETDHTKALKDLQDLATKKNISIPSTITDEGNNAYNKLNDKPAKDFDKAYCDMMVDGHKDAISKFQKAATDCSDEDVRTWAASMLSNLSIHLDHSLKCQRECSKM